MKITIENSDVKVTAQIVKFCGAYPDYASILDIDTTKMVNLNKGRVMLQFIIPEQETVHTYATTFTSYKNELMYGSLTGTAAAIPTLGAFPAVLPPLCDYNIIGLFREIVQLCVGTKKLTITMATALGIYVDPTVVDLSTGTPNLTLKSMSGGRPTLHSIIGGYDAFEVWKDAGIGFTRYDISNGPDYIDQGSLPAFGVEAIWKYKVIYRLKGVQIGNWSEIISVVVKGSI